MASTSGSAGMEDILFEHEERVDSQPSPKHPVFLSHSGAQKGFVEQLHEDLKSRGQASFFDQSPDSIPGGEDFSSRIFKAAEQCAVAVVVLSEEFLMSKWAMLELATFVEAQRTKNPKLKLFPLFYKLEASDLKGAILRNAEESWSKMAASDQRIDVDVWKNAIRVLARSNGERFSRHGGSKVKYRKAIVDAVCKLCRYYGQNRVPSMVGKDRLCGIVENELVKMTSSNGVSGPRILGLYGPAGIGKTFVCKALCDHLSEAYSGRTCYIDCSEGEYLEFLKSILEELTDIDEKSLRRIKTEMQGDNALKHFLPKQDVFLVLDNLRGGHLNWLLWTYLSISLTVESKMIVASRNLEDILNVVGNKALCTSCPTLIDADALKLFVQSAGCTQFPRQWTNEEERVLMKCMELSYYKDIYQSSSELYASDSITEEEMIKRCIKLSLSANDENENCGYYNPLLLVAMGTVMKEFSAMKPMELIEKCKSVNCVQRNERRALLDVFKSKRAALTSDENELLIDVVLHVPIMNLGDVEFVDILDRLLKWMEIVDYSPRGEILSKLERMKYFGVLAFRKVPEFLYNIFDALRFESVEVHRPQERCERFWRCCDKAIEIFTSHGASLEVSPESIILRDSMHEKCGTLYNRRGLARYFSGDTAGALDDYVRAKHYCPNSVDILHQTAVVQFDRGLFREALENLNQAISLYPSTREGINSAGTYADAFALRGLAKVAMNDDNGAQLDVDFAYGLNPDSTYVQDKRSAVCIVLRHRSKQ